MDKELAAKVMKGKLDTHEEIGLAIAFLAKILVEMKEDMITERLKELREMTV